MAAKRRWRLQQQKRWKHCVLSAAALVQAFAIGSCNVAFSADKPELTKLFPFGGQAGTAVEVEASGKFPVWPLQVWSDSESIRWTTLETSGKLKATIDADASPGIHWMRLHHPSGATAVRAFIVSKINVQIETEPNNRLSTANPITSLPACVQGVLHKRGEVDTFSVELKAGQKLLATVDAEQALHSPLDATLQLLDIDGFLLDESLDHFGLDPSINWVAPRDAKYFLRVFGFPATPDQTIAYGGGDTWIYRMRLETSGDACKDPKLDTKQSSEFPADAKNIVLEGGQAISREAALLLDPPNLVVGKIEREGEHRYFRFQASAGQYYRIHLRAREQGSELDPTLAILDSNGKQLTQQDDVGEHRDPDLKWKSPSDGEYFVDIQDFHKLGGAKFDFELLVSTLSPDFKLSIPSDLIQASVGKETEVEVAISRECDFAGEIVVSIDGVPEGVECATVVSESGKETAKKVTLRIKSTVPFQGPVNIVAKAKELDDRVHAASAEHGKPVWLSCVAE